MACGLAVILKGLSATGYEHCHSSQKFSQVLGATGIQLAISTPAQLCNLGESPFGSFVVTLLEQERRYVQQCQLAGQICQLVGIFFEGISDKDQGLDLLLFRLG